MISERGFIPKLIRVFGFAALSMSLSLALDISAEAQTAPPPQNTPAAQGAPAAAGASDAGGAGDTIAQLIASNSGTPKKICQAISPILYSTPEAASKVIDQAQASPELLEPLCECLSKTQRTLKKSDPAGAKVVANAVSQSSPAFQACYAVALSPGNSGGGSQVASNANSGAGSSGPSGAPYSPGISSGASGFSGGPVSPNSP